MITVVTMYRGYDAELFVQVVEGSLTQAQRAEWRKTFKCDEYSDEDTPDDDVSNMFFREFKEVLPNGTVRGLPAADGELRS